MAAKEKNVYFVDNSRYTRFANFDQGSCEKNRWEVRLLTLIPQLRDFGIWSLGILYTKHLRAKAAYGYNCR